MKKENVKINNNPLDYVKETKEDRLERIRTQATYTRVIPNKKKEYKRSRNKINLHKEITE